MHVHPELFGHHIIGQTGVFSSGELPGDLGGLLAALRMPAAVPDSIGGFLFETHVAYWVVAIVAAGIALYLGVNRQDAKLRKTGMILGALALLWAAAAMVVDTPAERLYRVHKDLAAAAEKGDVDRMVSCLTPDFQASVLGVETPAMAKQEIGDRLKAYGVKGSTIRSYKSAIQNKIASTTLTLLTQTDMGPIVSTWELSWDDMEGQDWRVRRATLLKLGDQSMGRDAVLPK